ncbi:ESX secretion-associated protein EspG, partial [Mycobacterium sp. NPDC003449]
MTATLTPHFAVTDDEMQVLAARLGVQALPVVLNLRSRHHTLTAQADAVDLATRTLSDRGLIIDGEVAADLVHVVRSLQRSDRELAMRLVTPDGLARVSVVRKGTQTVSACRVGNDIALDLLEDPTGQADLATRALLRRLPADGAA